MSTKKSPTLATATNCVAIDSVLMSKPLIGLIVLESATVLDICASALLITLVFAIIVAVAFIFASTLLNTVDNMPNVLVTSS